MIWELFLCADLNALTRLLINHLADFLKIINNIEGDQKNHKLGVILVKLQIYDQQVHAISLMIAIVHPRGNYFSKIK